MLSYLFSKLSGKNRKSLVRVENHYLYHFTGCIYCLRVEMALARFGLSIEKRNIYQSPEYYQELQNGGGKTTVPCLKIEKDNKIRWMYESGDIIKYLKEYSAR